MSSIIDNKLQIWKKKLLDLGKRNRLLNYKETKLSTLQIVHPSYDVLYKKLVLDEREITFPHVALKTILDEELEEGAVNKDDAEDSGIIEIPGDIKTNRSAKDTHRIAKNLRNRAKTTQEEQGVNVLYLSFGFLEWKEAEHSSIILKSPIVLVPVSLSVESITDPYVMSLHEDEIVVNPTLLYKLENDFGIILPEFDAQDSIVDYLEQVGGIVKNVGWRVNCDVSLSLLSFLKINMYKDLENRAETISNNPVVRAIAGYKNSSDYDFSGMDSFDHDSEEKVVETFQVVDADSSQQDAITMSKRGASFVLQGPPGTGKSQTITNIIAEGLADGKKILFVSEKMAALDVVYNRLRQSNIADFCLVLHSNKANKKELLDSFRQVLNLKNIQITDDAMNKLRTLNERRTALNKYCFQLHQKIQPMDQSVFEANGIIASLSNIPSVDFDFSNIDIASVDKNKLFEIRSSINEYVRTINNLSVDLDNNPWKHTTLTSVGHIERNTILSLLDVIINAIESFLDYWIVNQEDLGIECTYSFAQMQGLCFMFHHCGESHMFPAEYLHSFDYDSLLSKIKQAKERQNNRNIYKRDIDEYFTLGAYNLDAVSVCDRITKAKSNTKSFLYDGADEKYILDDAYSIVSEKKTSLEEFLSIMNTITDGLEYGAVNTIEDLSNLLEFFEKFSLEYRAYRDWFENKWNDKSERDRIIGEAENTAGKLKASRERLLNEYDDEILDVDYKDILTRCRTSYTSFTRMFKSDFKNDCNTIRALKKIPVKKITYEELVAIVDSLKEYHAIENEFNTIMSQNRSLFGGWYDDLNTSFDNVREVWDKFDSLLSTANCISPKMIDCIVSGSNMDIFKNEFSYISTFVEDGKLRDIIGLINKNIEFNNFEVLTDSYDEIHSELTLIKEEIDEIKPLCIGDFSYSGSYTVLQALKDYQILLNNEKAVDDKLKRAFFELFTGSETDWDYVKNEIDWVQQFLVYRDQYNLPDDFCLGIATNQKYIILSSELSTYIQDFYKKNMESMIRFDSYFEDSICKWPLKDILDKAKRCMDNIKDLEAWIDFDKSRKICYSFGLESLLDEIRQRRIPDNQIESVFVKAFERRWIDYAERNLSAVKRFRGRNQEERIKEFKQLDVEQLKISQLRIRERLIRNIPSLSSFTSGTDELSILRRELNKQRRIMPVRKLFDSIPNLLPTLKPCLMMSPLSVSQFLQSDHYSFDMVIFDEASQVRTENAIGAISRGKQVIIAGDIHQLPPTNFFASTISGSDEYDEEEDDSMSYESVLDEANAVLPQLTLRWHYRSRNEALIAFSNCKIYNHDLVTFPSSKDESIDPGIDYVYVKEGIYNRSTKRNNPVEAKVVVDKIFECIINNPNRSIGVITFSEAQQRCVEDEVLRRRLLNPDLEEFFVEDREEPFFIKNLENVQGDERDTIIFSIGYGKSNPYDDVRMNFGPLNKDGGYRRLNVAITRAKYNIKLVGSFMPTDLKVTESTPKGVKLLKEYMEYAINGQSVLETSILVRDDIRTESPFEDSVYDYLTQEGFDVATNVGCSGYRIDLAVRHPSRKGVFVLAVECDGATYHSSRTARERDRLRQSVLESMGWKFYRIWSTDWIKDPVAEGESLIKAVKAAIENYDNPNAPVKPDKEKNNTNHEYYKIKRSSERKESSFGEYKEFRFPKAIESAPLPKIAEAVNRIVEKQSPINLYYVAKQIAPLLGNEKVTDRISRVLDSIITAYSDKYDWMVRGDYLWQRAPVDLIPKIPSDDENIRKIELIAPEELAMAIQRIVEESFGINKEGAYKLVTLKYGFQRLTSQMESQLDIAYDLLISMKRVIEVDGKLTLAGDVLTRIRGGKGITNLVFVANGDLYSYDSNKEIRELIERKGGHFAFAVTNNTDFLISNDNLTKTKKLDEAIKKGIPIVTEAEFLAMINSV